MVGPPSGADFPGRCASFQHVSRTPKQSQQVKAELFGDGLIAMRLVVRKGVVSEQHMPVVQCAMDHVHPQVSPTIRWRNGCIFRFVESSAHVLNADLHEARISVRPIAFVGGPVRSQIALFENVYGQPRVRGGLDRLRVVLPRIAVENEVGRSGFPEPRAEPFGPTRRRTAVFQKRPRIAPPGAVARIECHPPAIGAGFAEPVRKLAEKWTMRALKEKKRAPLHSFKLHRCVCHCGTVSLEPASAYHGGPQSENAYPPTIARIVATGAGSCLPAS